MIKTRNSKLEIRKKVNNLIDCIKSNWITGLIVISAFFLYMLVIYPSGSFQCIDSKCGIHFWGAHEHDGVWHIAIIESAFQSYPFIFPTFYGQFLSGYNFLLDIVILLIVKFGISSWDVYFRLLPTIWFIVFVLVLKKFSEVRKNSVGYFPILLFVILFSSSLGFIIQLKNNHNIWGSSGIPTMQGALSMTNPQYLWSLIFVLLLWNMLRENKRNYLSGFYAFILLGLKFYAVLPAIVMIGIAGMRDMMQKKWSSLIHLIISSFLGGVLAYMVFYSSNKSSGLVFSPMSLPKQIVEDPNMWHMASIIQTWYTLSQAGNIFSPRLWIISFIIILLFVVFNFGIRLLGVLADIVKLLKGKLTFDNAVIITVFFASILVPVLFIQKGDWWNTIQFLYYGIFVSSISLANNIHSIFIKKKIVFWSLLLVLILLFLPAQVDLIRSFALGGSTYISRDELDSLTKLKSYKNGIVLVQPFFGNSTSILADTIDTSYVSALSGKQTFMADEIQMRLLGIDYKGRMDTLKENPCTFLSQVDYVYIRKNHTHNLLGKCIREESSFVMSYSNDTTEVWRKK
ncbi:MAG: hypothetical protein U0525_00370 [Patescibacteria group bacterium]